ncbi:MAG: phosphoribosyltransferase family protein [Bacteroidota bacterium]
MLLLNRDQIAQKINRLAMEIMEQNTDEDELFIIGINNRGYELGRRIQARLEGMAEAPIHLWNVRLSPADPMEKAAELSHPVEQLAGKAILIVDDVANTGRTLFYAMRPIFAVLPKKLEVAVLVDRAHKSFPIHVNYVGLELSTTIQNNILVNFGEEEQAVLE